MGNPSDKVYPISVLLDYWNLEPTIPGHGQTRISVNSYKCSLPIFGGTVQEELIKDAFIQVSKGRIVGEAGGARQYVSAFVGKASPETFETVLTLIYEYREAFLSAYGKSQAEPYRTCAKILSDETAPPRALQSFCDRFMGLDCNGFVGNFVKRADHSLKLDPSSPIRGFYDKRKAVRTRAEDIRDRDVIIWSNFLHVAAIDHVTRETGKVMVTQSTAGGPQAKDYAAVPLKGGMFRFEPHATKFGGSVYIVDLGI